MKKAYTLMAIVLLASMILTACGGGYPTYSRN